MFLNRFYKRTRDVCGAYGQQSVDDYAHALVVLVACHAARHTLEFAGPYANGLALLELLDFAGRHNDVIGIGGADYFQTVNLIVGHYQRYMDEPVADVCAGVIKTKIGEIDVVVNKHFQLLFSAESEKDVGYARLFYCGASAVYQFYAL